MISPLLADIAAIKAAVEALCKEGSPVTIFINGLPGSGKTTFAKHLARQYPGQAAVLGLDWFVYESSRQRKAGILQAVAQGDAGAIRTKTNPLNWYDFNHFYQALQTLQQAHRLELDTLWNQQSGELDLSVSLQIPDQGGIIVCEGAYLMDQRARAHGDIIVLLEVSLQTCQMRMAARDGHRNGPEYLQVKQKITLDYDIPYTTSNRCHVDFILAP